MRLYSVFDFGSMIADRVRMDAFRRALESHVTPESVVLDIGAGTGIFALLACRLGARRVYAVEPDDSIQLAKELAAANGLTSRIEFFQQLSTEVTLPEPADVMVADIGGLLPWFQHHLPSIIDARTRLLRPGGAMIPQCDLVSAGLTEAPDFYARYTNGWNEPQFGLDMTIARDAALNTSRRFRPTSEQFLAPPQRWKDLDYATITDVGVHERLPFVVARAGTAHGFCLWFDRRTATGIQFTNGPNPEGDPSASIYSPLFFPFRQPVSVRPNDVVRVSLRGDLVGDDYVWRWDTDVFDGPGETARRLRFEQSTFHGVALSPASLRRKASTYRPAETSASAIARFVLSEVNKGLTLGEIATSTQAAFPDRFPRWHDALTHVSVLAERYQL